MNGKEYIEACKKKLNLDTDYKLALHLEISQSDMNFYSRGTRLPSVYACFKIGECLGIDPSIIMADIASETEKNPHKRDFFKSFIASCKMAVAGLFIMTALLNSTTDEGALSAS